MKVVVDTNVLVSGLINPQGHPGRIVDLLRVGVLQVVVDDRILAEYRDVLAREAFHRYFSKRDREDMLNYLDSNALHIAPRMVLPPLPDPGDTPFLEVALSEEAPLVTGSANHFPAERRRDCEVFGPAEFLRRHFPAGSNGE